MISSDRREGSSASVVPALDIVDFGGRGGFAVFLAVPEAVFELRLVVARVICSFFCLYMFRILSSRSRSCFLYPLAVICSLTRLYTCGVVYNGSVTCVG